VPRPKVFRSRSAVTARTAAASDLSSNYRIVRASYRQRTIYGRSPPRCDRVPPYAHVVNYGRTTSASDTTSVRHGPCVRPEAVRTFLQSCPVPTTPRMCPEKTCSRLYAEFDLSGQRSPEIMKRLPFSSVPSTGFLSPGYPG
jgi:hypothetical protein